MRQSAEFSREENPHAGLAALFTQSRGWVRAVVVIAATAFVTAGALSKSELLGRLANPSTHNDVNYLIDGIQRLLYIEVNGFWSELSHLRDVPLHAPFAAYQAALAFYLFGFHDWAPYLSDIFLLIVLFSACVRLLRGYPDVILIACVLAVAGMPLTSVTITEFAPEMPLGLFVALGIVAALPIPLTQRAPGARFAAGLLFGIAFLAKPSSFVFVPVVVSVTLSVTFLRDIVFAKQWSQWNRAIANGLIGLVLALWLPALYLIPNFSDFSHYFYMALFDKSNLEAYGYKAIKTNASFYLTGYVGEYIFGDLLWVYFAIVSIGLVAARYRGDHRFIRRQVELLAVGIVLWALPTFSTAKNTLFAAPFAYLLALMVVLALRSIYETTRGVFGTSAVSLLGVLLLVSGTSRPIFPNTSAFALGAPSLHVIREAWPQTQDRLREVMLGNSPNYYGRFVYLTNVGYYHDSSLKYWFLKKDMTLDWDFDTLWWESETEHHLDYIHHKKADFVVAGERDNGLTFKLPLIAGAAGSEDAVLAAMWDDPNYMPIDRFYGPTGRTITVFQRSTAFAGWRLLAGLYQSWGPDGPWISKGTVAHLGAYAPDDVKSRLAVEAEGQPGQVVTIFVNSDQIGELTFDANGVGSLDRPCDLARGENDIVLRYSVDAPITFRRLLVARQIARAF